MVRSNDFHTEQRYFGEYWYMFVVQSLLYLISFLYYIGSILLLMKNVSSE